MRTISLLLSVCLSLAAALALLGLLSPMPVAGEPGDLSFVVNDQGDGQDLSLGNGVCDIGGNRCTLRAAIQEANAQYAAHGGFYTITLPGAFTINTPPRVISLTLTGSGEDHALTGDLDIACNLLIRTSNGLPALINAINLGDRVFEITSTSGVPIVVSFANLWIANGSGVEAGGAIDVGPHNSLSLLNVRVLSNTVSGQFAHGGGIFADFPSTLTLTNVIVRNNKAIVGAGGLGIGGGLYALGPLSIDRSTFVDNLITYDNPAHDISAEGGAISVICCPGPVVITGSLVTSNSIRFGGANQTANGGGISAEGDKITITNSAINANTIAGGSGILAAEGAGLYLQGNLRVENSLVSANLISTTSGAGFLDGGGMALNGRAQIISSTIQNNFLGSGGGLGGYGGGLNLGGAIPVVNVLLDHSLLLDNLAAHGGGLNTYLSTTLSLRSSTLEGNVAVVGGGIFNDGVLSVTNSTFYFNVAVTNGGGLFDENQASVDSATFNANVAGRDGGNLGDGGALFANNGSTLFLRNSLLSGNADNTTSGPILPDCAGTIISLGYNLIEQRASVASCTVLNGSTDIHGTFPGVMDSMPRFNGGNTQTIALPPGSAAINAGDPAGCKDETGSPLLTDQRGFPRLGPCDIGAFEYGVQTWLPLVVR